MGVRLGFKQSEAGLIPEDWDAIPLRQHISSLEAGVSVNSVEEERDAHGHDESVLKTSSVSGGKFIAAECKKILPKDLRRAKLSPVRDSILVSRMNTPVLVGESGYVDRDCPTLFLPDRLWMTKHFVPSPPNVRWLAQTLAFGSVRQSIRDCATGTSGSMKNISKDALLSIYIPTPSGSNEQFAIAEALSDADALVDALEQLIAKKRQIKQGAMQELLTGKLRLPGFSGEWKARSLGELGSCFRGVSYSPDVDLRSSDTDETIRLLRSNNVQDSIIELDGLQFVGRDRVSGVQILRKNDVLICMANGSKELVGKAARFNVEDGMRYTFGAFMGCFRPDAIAGDPGYTFCLFHTEAYRRHIIVLLAGSSINNLTPGNVEGFMMEMPADRVEQTAIAAALSEMDTELAALEIKLAKASQIKQGMTQELLTGRIRLV